MLFDASLPILQADTWLGDQVSFAPLNNMRLEFDAVDFIFDSFTSDELEDATFRYGIEPDEVEARMDRLEKMCRDLLDSMPVLSELRISTWQRRGMGSLLAQISTLESLFLVDVKLTPLEFQAIGLANSNLHTLLLDGTVPNVRQSHWRAYGNLKKLIFGANAKGAACAVINVRLFQLMPALVKIERKYLK